MITKYKDGKWVKESKEEVMDKEDLEGKKPCEKCWKSALDNGVYSWPLREEFLKAAKRCPKCGRII